MGEIEEKYNLIINNYSILVGVFLNYLKLTCCAFFPTITIIPYDVFSAAVNGRIRGYTSAPPPYGGGAGPKISHGQTVHAKTSIFTVL